MKGRCHSFATRAAPWIMFCSGSKMRSMRTLRRKFPRGLLGRYQGAVMSHPIARSWRIREDESRTRTTSRVKWPTRSKRRRPPLQRERLCSSRPARDWRINLTNQPRTAGSDTLASGSSGSTCWWSLASSLRSTVARRLLNPSARHLESSNTLCNCWLPSVFCWHSATKMSVSTTRYLSTWAHSQRYNWCYWRSDWTIRMQHII